MLLDCVASATCSRTARGLAAVCLTLASASAIRSTAARRARPRLLDGRDRQQRRDLLAPQVEPLVQRAALRAGRQVQLRLARPRAGSPARTPAARPAARRPRSRARRAAPARSRPTVMIRSSARLTRARREPEVLGDLGSAAPVAVQRDDLALALGQPLQHRARHPLDLGLVLALDQLLLGRGATPGRRVSSGAARVGRQLALRPRCGAAGRPARGGSSCAATLYTSPSVCPRQCAPASRHASWKASSTSSRVAPGCHAATCERSALPSSPQAMRSISSLVGLRSTGRPFFAATTVKEDGHEKLAPLATRSGSAPTCSPTTAAPVRRPVTRTRTTARKRRTPAPDTRTVAGRRPPRRPESPSPASGGPGTRRPRPAAVSRTRPPLAASPPDSRRRGRTYPRPPAPIKPPSLIWHA